MEWSVSGASSVSIDSIKTVAVLGAGTMGNGIAHVFARSGYRVILRDVEQRFLDRGMETIGKNLDREIKKLNHDASPVVGRLLRRVHGKGEGAKEAPRFVHLLPQLPRLLHGALQPQPAVQQRLLEALLVEQRRTNRLLAGLAYSAVGFLLGLVAMQVVLRL